MSGNIKTAFGADLFAGAIAGATVKDASGRVVYKNETNVPGMASFQESAKCTLPANFDVSSFNKDFSKGGWAAWDQMLEPQNNLFGIYTMALGEQQAQIATEQTATMNSAVAGNGFLAQKLGVGSSGMGPTGCTNVAGTLGNGSQGPTMTTRCTFMGKDVTPPEILSQSAANAIDTKLKRPGAATELTDIVMNLFASILDATTSRLANYIGQATYDSAPSPVNYDTSQFNEDTTVNSQNKDATANSQAGGPQAQSITNETNQAINQVKSSIPPAGSASNGLDDSGACMDICLAGGTDKDTCDTRCNNQSTPTPTPMTTTDPNCVANCLAGAQGDRNSCTQRCTTIIP
jgi:hypothetical protein